MTDEERKARIHYHEYSGEGIREHAERIVALEELIIDMLDAMSKMMLCPDNCPRSHECEGLPLGSVCPFCTDAEELGIEVGE